MNRGGIDGRPPACRGRNCGVIGTPSGWYPDRFSDNDFNHVRWGAEERESRCRGRGRPGRRGRQAARAHVSSTIASMALLPPRTLLQRLNPLLRLREARRRRVLREVVAPLQVALGRVHEAYVEAYETLLAEIAAHPRYATNRIIDSVQDGRRHLKTYQLVLPDGKPDVRETWMAVSSRLEVLSHALVWSSKAFKRARDQLARYAPDPEAPAARTADAYFQALAMYLTIRSRGALTFRIYPDRISHGSAGFGPGVDLEAIIDAPRTPVAQVVSVLVYERTDETVTRDLGELVEGALWTKRKNWRTVEAAYQALEIDG
jgi:hypothetical protein